MVTEAATFCRTLVEEWVRLGLTDAVVCPGSRSAPLALALDEDRRLRTHVHQDERCGGFMALGLGLASGRPAVVVTTSGTAAVELHPAVVEAHQACVPLIACTADRPPELHGVGAPQTIDQRDLFGRAVRWFADPGPPSRQQRDRWRPLAARAVAEATSSPPGPVHLNLAFRDPLVGEAGPVPEERPVELRELITRRPGGDLPAHKVGELVEVLGHSRGVIVAGVRTVGDRHGTAAVLALAQQLGWPVLADHQSGCRVPDPSTVSAFDALLRVTDFADRHRPEVVLRFGGLLTSQALNEWLAGCPAEQIGVDRYGQFADPERSLDQRITADPAAVCRQLLDHAHEGHSSPAWVASWQQAEAAAVSALDAVLGAAGEISEPGAARDLLAAMPAGSSLVVSSSMPVRYLERYGRPRWGCRVLSNRGANGIDGVLSTALGVAETGVPTAALLGDLAFLHDSNALIGLAGRRVDLTVVVIDNDGGGIFSFLPQATAVARPRFEKLFAAPHAVDLCGLADGFGARALMVSDTDAYRQVLGRRFDSQPDGGPDVIVVESDRTRNAAIHRELNRVVEEAVKEALTAG